jgi:type I restriction enzyme S subunit
MKNDVLLGNIRPYLKKIWLANNEGGTNGDVLVIRVNDSHKEVIHPAYLYQVLSSNHFFDFDTQNSKGVKMPRGDKDTIMDFIVPVPSLEVQKRIVTTLENFTSLTRGLSEGLPAEIKARRQQYEYYRNKLLTF